MSGDHSWFFADRNGTPVLMRALNVTNSIERVWETHPDEPSALTGDTMWIVSRERGELRRVALPMD